MIAPGYTADACLHRPSVGLRFSIPIEDGDQKGKVVAQSCPADVLGICSIWLQYCLAHCGWVRLFGGPGACSTCMTGCLYIVNPLLAPVCTSCATPGPCTVATAVSASLGCPYNVCR